ncbi:hypothetical protein ACTWQE_26390, partial [Streptomyces sp. 8N706]
MTSRRSGAERGGTAGAGPAAEKTTDGPVAAESSTVPGRISRCPDPAATSSAAGSGTPRAAGAPPT